MRSSFISFNFTGSDEGGGNCKGGAALAAGGFSSKETAAVVCILTDSNFLASHSWRRAVCDGLSHCAKQHGTHNPLGCASFFKNPG